MEYKFLHAPESNLYVDDPEYPGIHTIFDLYDALNNVWCRNSCTPRLRKKWNEKDKTIGQCTITAFLAQDIFGGEVIGVPLGDGNYHHFNQVGDEIFDLTIEQFHGEVLDYERAVERDRYDVFENVEKKLRYVYLKVMLQTYLKFKYGKK